MAQKTIPVRSEADVRRCWAVEDIFPTEEAWEAELEACKSMPAELASYAGRLGESAEVLLDYLNTMERINRRVEKLFVYAYLRLDEDTANAAHQAMKGRCFSFVVELSSAAAFEGPELVALEEETLNRFYAEAPGLEKYRRYLTKARLERAHILSKAEENLLAAQAEVSGAPSEIYNTFLNADLSFPDVADSEGTLHPLTNGSYIPLVENRDRTLRKNAFEAFYARYKEFENTTAACYQAEVKKNIFHARARKYNSALAAAMEPSEVPVEVYHNLLAAVHENLPQLHRYMALRKKIMGLDELHMYDIYVNLVPDAEEEISFERAAEEVAEAMAVLGEDYTAMLRESVSARWMDVYENKGKCSGAYSCHCPDVHPFVLLNHKDDLSSEFTVAHELGHAMHSYLSDRAQPPVYADYVLFVAEVASTCNEALLMQHLLAKENTKEKEAFLLNYFLEQFRTTLFRQAMFAEFELQAHEMAERGETLTAAVLNELYLELNRVYYGDAVVVDPAIAGEWARIPHFYRCFYVYQYATGFSAAMALSDRILREGQVAVEDYLRFLSGGSSADPVTLLKQAGVDMSTPQPVNAAMDLFAGLIDRLEGLIG